MLNENKKPASGLRNFVRKIIAVGSKRKMIPTERFSSYAEANEDSIDEVRPSNVPISLELADDDMAFIGSEEKPKKEVKKLDNLINK
jgi:hypothetical protein